MIRLALLALALAAVRTLAGSLPFWCALAGLIVVGEVCDTLHERRHQVLLRKRQERDVVAGAERVLRDAAREEQP